MVEKGVWDNIFSLKGGWHVHMKLQFVLSEEERQRIRVMVLFLYFSRSYFDAMDGYLYLICIQINLLLSLS